MKLLYILAASLWCVGAGAACEPCTDTACATRMLQLSVAACNRSMSHAWLACGADAWVTGPRNVTALDLAEKRCSKRFVRLVQDGPYSL